MEFSQIDDALQVCKRHLSELDESDFDRILIENLLVSSIVLLMVSNYENLIKEQFVERARQSCDESYAKFVEKSLDRVFRSPQITRITSSLKAFGGDELAGFKRLLDQGGRKEYWENIINARHRIVHKKDVPQMTMRELEEAYEHTKEVLIALRQSLGLDGNAI